MQDAITITAITIACILTLIWNQPKSLTAWADRIERWSHSIVRRMRIRAIAKADANRAYERSYAWHSRVW
jgi:hypothetical protein